MVTLLKYFVFSLCMIGVVHAQCYSLVHDYGNDFTIYAGSIYKNGKLYVNGTVADTASPYKNLSYFAQIDTATGHTISYQTFYYPLSDINIQESCFTEISGNKFVSVGSFNFGQQAIALFYDSTGVVYDTTFIDDSINIKLYPKHTLYKDNAIYVMILRTEPGNDVNTWIVKLNLDGDIIWTRSYGTINLSEIPGSLLDLDTCILVGSSRSTFNHVPYTVEEESQTWLFTIDTAGNLLHEWLDPDKKTYFPNRMLKTPDGKIILAGGYRGDYVWSDWNQVLLEGYLSLFDIYNWQKEWWNSYGYYSPKTYFQDVDTMGGGYLLTGLNPYGPIPYNPHGGWLLKTDLLGNRLWERIYQPFLPPSSNSLVLLRESHVIFNKGILSTGWGDDGTGYHGWVIRTDEYGCLIEDCQYTGIEEIPEQGLLIYPNPAKDIIYLQSSEELTGIRYSVMDISGRIIQNGIITSSDFSLNIQNLTPGVYILHFEKDGQYRVVKFVKE